MKTPKQRSGKEMRGRRSKGKETSPQTRPPASGSYCSRRKVQIDAKEVPYNRLRGKVRENGKPLYQWTAIDECTRMRFVYTFVDIRYSSLCFFDGAVTPL